jgi:hypothetical protein
MRVIVFVKADKNSEGGKLPTAEMISEMQTFNQQLADAGVIIMAEGLQPSANAARIHFGDTGKHDIEDGPFDNPEELVAGFWIWNVDSVDHALGWLKRSPFKHAIVEVRPIYEAADFSENLTPELAAREQALRDKLASY